MKKLFAGYYAKNKVEPPPELQRREFGFGFDKKIEYRHKSFASPSQLQDFLASEAPLFASYSVALYRFPDTTPMANKDFLGADLAFDLDEPSRKCGEHNPVLCKQCLELIKRDALHLIEGFLLDDFGFSRSEVSLVYTGHKGYHVHLKSKAVRALSQSGRRELLNYLRGPASLESLVFKYRPLGTRAYSLLGPRAGSRGWKKKFFDYAASFLEAADEEGLRAKGFTRPKARQIVERKAFLLEKMRGGNWDALPGCQRLWEELFSDLVASQALAPDAQVTLDTARLIRLPGSLHGDTGLVASPIRNPERFDPLVDAVAFSQKEVVEVAPVADCVVDLLGRSFSFKKGVKARVPLPVAVLLACKHKLK